MSRSTRCWRQASLSSCKSSRMCFSIQNNQERSKRSWHQHLVFLSLYSSWWQSSDAESAMLSRTGSLSQMLKRFSTRAAQSATMPPVTRRWSRSVPSSPITQRTTLSTTDVETEWAQVDILVHLDICVEYLGWNILLSIYASATRWNQNVFTFHE